ncbi:MAG TPA: type II toxin-antitoxin system RelE/ParE family toxin [Thermoanaerobaculia bacterium]
MSFRFKVGPRAGRQIRAAAKWWAENRSAAPALLREELEAAYALIADLPLAGQTVPHSRIVGLRRVLLSRTQYHLYYVVPDDAVIEVLALWHTSRGVPPPL